MFGMRFFLVGNRFSQDTSQDVSQVEWQVKTISRKTIRIKCDKKQKADTDENSDYSRNNLPHPPRKMLKNENTIKENSIEAESTIEMSLRLLGGMDESDIKDSSETEEKREKKRKLEETSKGKSTRTSEESIFQQEGIIDAIRKSDEKMEKYSRKSDEKMDKFLQTVTDSVGTQLHGLNSTIVKMKEEDDKYKQIIEKLMNMEKKILDIHENVKTEVAKPGGAHGDQNQGKAVTTGFHSETSESEVPQHLKENDNRKRNVD